MFGKAVVAAVSMGIWCILTGTSAAQSQFLRQDKGAGIIIFIHGLIGDAKTTWEKDPKHVYWPQLVKEDGLFNGMDILVYDYPSSLVSQGFTIQGLADQLKINLHDPDINITSYERIVIVAHSLGGIVARKYILQTPAIQNRIKGLFLFATPMDGSALANAAAKISPNPTVGQLQKPRDPDAFLNTLRKDWIDAKLSLSIHTGCAFEAIGMGFSILSRRVVERASVEPLCNAGLAEINQDHITLVQNRFWI